MSFLNKPLFKNVDSFFLGLFRFVFGAFMLIEMVFYLKSVFFKDSVMVPYYNFPYDYLEFISLMGDSAMGFVHFMMGLSAILIMIGYFEVSNRGRLFFWKSGQQLDYALKRIFE